MVKGIGCAKFVEVGVGSIKLYIGSGLLNFTQSVCDEGARSLHFLISFEKGKYHSLYENARI